MHLDYVVDMLIFVAHHWHKKKKNAGLKCAFLACACACVCVSQMLKQGQEKVEGEDGES